MNGQNYCFNPLAMLNPELFRQLQKMQAGSFVQQGLLPGVQAHRTNSAYSQVALPNNGGAITAEVPVGQGTGPISLPTGLSVPESVTLVIDTTSIPKGTNPTGQKILLFDEGRYYRSKTGSPDNPANLVYVGSASNNLYSPFVSELCAKVFHVHGISIDAQESPTADATGEQQLQEIINVYRINARESHEYQTLVDQYKDPKNYDQGKYVIPLTDHKGRIDRNTAWSIKVFDQMRITITLYFAAVANS